MPLSQSQSVKSAAPLEPVSLAISFATQLDIAVAFRQTVYRQTTTTLPSDYLLWGPSNIHLKCVIPKFEYTLLHLSFASISASSLLLVSSRSLIRECLNFIRTSLFICPGDFPSSTPSSTMLQNVCMCLFYPYVVYRNRFLILPKLSIIEFDSAI